jgi:hypothetical protein
MHPHSEEYREAVPVGGAGGIGSKRNPFHLMRSQELSTTQIRLVWSRSPGELIKQ